MVEGQERGDDMTAGEVRYETARGTPPRITGEYVRARLVGTCRALARDIAGGGDYRTVVVGEMLRDVLELAAAYERRGRGD